MSHRLNRRNTPATTGSCITAAQAVTRGITGSTSVQTGAELAATWPTGVLVLISARTVMEPAPSIVPRTVRPSRGRSFKRQMPGDHMQFLAGLRFTPSHRLSLARLLSFWGPHPHNLSRVAIAPREVRDQAQLEATGRAGFPGQRFAIAVRPRVRMSLRVPRSARSVPAEPFGPGRDARGDLEGSSGAATTRSKTVPDSG